MSPLFRKLIVGILVAIGLVVLSQYTVLPNKELPVNRPLTAAESAEIQSLLKAVQKELVVTSEISSHLPITPEWKNNRYDLIRLNGYSFFLHNDPVIDIATEGFIETLSQDMDLAFTKSGAQVNDFNYDISGLVREQKAYTKGDIRCLAQFYSGGEPYGLVFCGLEDPVAKRWLATLDQAADPSYDPNVILNVQKVVGNDAKVLLNSRYGGGSFALLQKKGLKWQKVFEGQDIPECSLVDRYKIDQRIYENCYYPATGKTRFE